MTTTSRLTIGGLLDRLLDKGAVVTGDVVIGLADIDLILLDLRVLLTGVEAGRRRSQLPPGGLHRAPSPRAEVDPAVPPPLPARLDLDDERPEHGLVGLVVLLVGILREVIEGQAVARLEGGSLTPDEVERLGRALHLLDLRINSLHEWLDSSRRDLTEAEGDRIPWR